MGQPSLILSSDTLQLTRQVPWPPGNWLSWGLLLMRSFKKLFKYRVGRFCKILNHWIGQEKC